MLYVLDGLMTNVFNAPQELILTKRESAFKLIHFVRPLIKKRKNVHSATQAIRLSMTSAQLLQIKKNKIGLYLILYAQPGAIENAQDVQINPTLIQRESVLWQALIARHIMKRMEIAFHALMDINYKAGDAISQIKIGD